MEGTLPKVHCLVLEEECKCQRNSEEEKLSLRRYWGSFMEKESFKHHGSKATLGAPAPHPSPHHPSPLPPCARSWLQAFRRNLERGPGLSTQSWTELRLGRQGHEKSGVGVPMPPLPGKECKKSEGSQSEPDVWGHYKVIISRVGG